MNQNLLEKHKDLVIDIALVYLDNMELELGKKYKDNFHDMDASLSIAQSFELRTKHKVAATEFDELYAEFQKMKPTQHLTKAMEAFTASGGNVDIEPYFDEDSERLKMSIKFVIKGNTLDKIEGLSTIEDLILKMDAMHQVNELLSGPESEDSELFE